MCLFYFFSVLVLWNGRIEVGLECQAMLGDGSLGHTGICWSGIHSTAWADVLGELKVTLSVRHVILGHVILGHVILGHVTLGHVGPTTVNLTRISVESRAASDCCSRRAGHYAKIPPVKAAEAIRNRTKVNLKGSVIYDVNWGHLNLS